MVVSRPMESVTIAEQVLPRLDTAGWRDELGSVVELAGAFGGADRLHEAIDELGRRLFDVS